MNPSLVGAVPDAIRALGQYKIPRRKKFLIQKIDYTCR